MLYLKKLYLNGELTKLIQMGRDVTLQEPLEPVVGPEPAVFETPSKQPPHEHEELREVWLEGLKVCADTKSTAMRAERIGYTNTGDTTGAGPGPYRWRRRSGPRGSDARR